MDPHSWRKALLHLAVGMFDGVHLGHQALIAQASHAAAADGHTCGVLTFDPHPSRILRPAEATHLLMPLDQRIRRMHDAGADFVFVKSFSHAYAATPAAGFVAGLNEMFPTLRSLHVGENFRFGAGRDGDVIALAALAESANVHLQALPRQRLGDERISSSRIRAALTAGDMSLVNAMLGSSYTVEGTIIPGKGLGRRLDYPTLNIAWCPEVLPHLGVYRVLLKRMAGHPLPGIANYGLRPTFEQDTTPLLEVHLLAGDSFPGPGESVRVELLEFIRPERSFASAEALRMQIAEDVEQVRSRWREPINARLLAD